jgi:chromosome partitioning protein
MEKKCKIVTFVNHKGGVGKTTLTLFSARILAESSRVLCVDFDPQANLTHSFGIQSRQDTLLDCLVGNRPIQDVILTPNPNLPNLHLIPSNLHLEEIEIRLISTPGRDKKLSRALNLIRDQYDFILIDSAPRGGYFLLAPLLAATDVIIPVDASEFSLQGLDRTQNVIAQAREAQEAEFRVRVVQNQMDRYSTNKDQREILLSQYPEVVLRSTIRKTVDATKITNSQDPSYLSPSAPLWGDVEDFLREAEFLV